MLYEDRTTSTSKQIPKEKIENLETEAVTKYEIGKKDEALASQALLLI